MLAMVVIAAALRAAWTTASAVESGAAVDSDLLDVIEATIGFEGKYRAGFWTPVHLKLRAGAQPVRGRLLLQADDGDGVPVRYDAAEDTPLVDLQPGEEATVLRYFRAGPQRGSVDAVLLDAESDQVLARQSLADRTPRAALATQELFVTVGNEVGIEEGLKLTRRSDDVAAIHGRALLSDLPDQPWGYDGVDWLIVPTRSPALDSLTDAQFEAIRQWVSLGGKLLLCAGSRAGDVLAADSPWNVFAPGKLQETRPLRDRAGLETFAQVELAWNDEAFQNARPSVAQFKSWDGILEVSETGTVNGKPLAIRRPYGFGHVLFVAVDLDDPQLAAWRGRPRLIANLLARWKSEANESANDSRRAIQHLGYEDLIGQLRSSLEQFPSVTVVSFATVAVLTVVYLLLVGPVDFLLFRRHGTPAHGTWVTFPLVVLGFAVAAWLIGASAHGGKVRLNEAEIVDVDAVNKLVRGSAWQHLYSPASDRFDLFVHVDARELTPKLPANGWLAWQGLPGQGLGGLASQQVGLAQPLPYTIQSPGPKPPPGGFPAIEGLPTAVASSKALAATWWGNAESLDLPALATNEFGLPEGAVRNPFSVELEDCILAYDEWLYRLGTMPAGGEIELKNLQALNLESRLMQRTVVDAKDFTLPWDRASSDVPQIMRMLMFHEIAHGRDYTGLTHRYQPQLDFSDQVRSGRAVFVGRAGTMMTTLRGGSAAPTHLDNISEAPLADGGNLQSWSWRRVVLPVNKRATR